MTKENAVLELVKLLSEAIDMIRNDGRDNNADYIDKQMQTILDKIKK